MNSFKIQSPNVVIIIVLILFLTIIMVASGSAIYFLTNDANTLRSIVDNDIEQQHLYKMNRAATKRILYIHKMLESTDPFEQDKLYTLYEGQSVIFTESSLPLKKLFTGEDEDDVWDIMSEKIDKLLHLENKIVTIIREDIDGSKSYRAGRILNEEAVPAQDRLLKFLSAMLDYTQEKIQDEYHDSVIASQNAINFIIFISFVAMLFSVIVGVGVYRLFLRYEGVINFEKDKAIKANIKKSQFLSNMSHEIRTPLTAIIGFSHAIRKLRSDDVLFEKFSNKIIRNGRHLLDLINNVLDLSKIEAGEINIEKIPVSPISILEEVVSIVSGLADSKGLHFETNLLFPLPRKINSDPVRLKQILINLCSNAIKFTDKGSVIIRVSFDQFAHILEFRVIDTGIGMNEEALKHIFLPFSQADNSTTRKFGGTGLGLNISKRLSLKLDAELSCSSIENIGSEFKFKINIGDVALADMILEQQYDNHLNERHREHDNIAPMLSGTILIVEDNIDNCDLISMYIEETHASYQIVSNGQLALDECITHQKHFDLILMDMQMPVMDGFEAVTQLREYGYHNPIVMLTANALKVDVDKSIAIGADGHLAKPIDLDKFYKVLGKYLEYR